MVLTAPPVARTVGLPLTGEPPDTAIETDAPAKATGRPHLKSDDEHDAPVGLIVGVSLAVIAGIVALALVRLLFLRRARRREHHLRPLPSAAPPPPPSAMDRMAVELAGYPPMSSTDNNNSNNNNTSNNGSGDAWPQPFSRPAPPAAGSSPAAHQAYLAAELRRAQTQLERIGVGSKGGKEAAAVKRHIREPEERQQSAWALGLDERHRRARRIVGPARHIYPFLWVLGSGCERARAAGARRIAVAIDILLLFAGARSLFAIIIRPGLEGLLDLRPRCAHTPKSDIALLSSLVSHI
ncbi:hypothetical protein C8J57DRAFT_1601946 [Mycena rebaudengoi]|nr:hypothetical protein C8J57DRAFT_1601946 [Mycena rebaudengoi]